MGEASDSSEKDEETERLEKEAVALAYDVERLEERLVAALEGRDMAGAERLEGEIRTAEARRDACAAVARNRREEQDLRDTAAGRGLLTIVYASAFNEALAPEDIGTITRVSSSNNRITGVTSCLLFSISRGFFVQYLEGDAGKVDSLFQKVSRDTRHKDVTLLRREQASCRSFAKTPMSVVDMSGAGDAVERAVSLLMAHAVTAAVSLQPAVRDVLTRGGDPMFLQPARANRIAMRVSLHAARTFASLNLPETHISELFNTFADLVVRCAHTNTGTISAVRPGSVDIRWGYSEIKHAKQTLLDVVSAFDELRGCGGLPLGGVLYPCVAVAAGSGIVMRHRTHAGAAIEMVGPVVDTLDAVCAAGEESMKQVVVSAQMLNSLAFSRSFELVDVPFPAGCGRGDRECCYTVREIAGVPPDLRALITAAVLSLAAEGRVTAASPRTAPPPDPSDVALLPPVPPPPTEQEVALGALPSSVPVLSAVEQLLLLHPQHPSTGEAASTPAPLPQNYLRSDRVFLSEDELMEQFRIIDINENGYVSRAEFRHYFERFDDMGVCDAADKVEASMGEKERLSFNDFCIVMLKLAQD